MADVNRSTHNFARLSEIFYTVYLLRYVLILEILRIPKPPFDSTKVLQTGGIQQST